jgi:hypothetical protein
MSNNPPAEEAVGVRSKAAAMLGMPMPGAMKMPMVGMGGGPASMKSVVGSTSDSVLNNSKSDGMVSAGGGLGGSSTPDLFSFSFNIELKGQFVNVEVGASALMSEVYEKALTMFGEKLRKDGMERVLFFKETSIYLPHSRRADSFLITPDIGESIELELKKKDKKATPIVVIVDGSKTETVEINPNTTVLGVIQLLPRKNLDDDFMTLFNKKGKIDWMTKVSSVIKKEEALECKIDADLKTAGSAGINLGIGAILSQSSYSKKKSSSSNNRKSMAPSSSLKGISPVGSGSGSPSGTNSKSPSMTPSSSLSSIPTASSKEKEKDKKNLERLLTNRPSEADLKKKNIIVDFKTDAKAAAPAAVDPNSALPLQLSLFMQLGAYLKGHLDLVGLFRVSGDVEEVKGFYQSMFGPSPKINWEASAHDPHIASSALKLYLRKQADPLIPFSLYNEFMTAQKTEDEENQRSLIKSAIEKMPQPNASILQYLIHLLTLVAAREPVNKMSPINIGIVFGPTIMWDPKPNVMDFSSTGYQSSLVTNMIDHYSTFWTASPPSDDSSGDSTVSSTNGNSGNSEIQQQQQQGSPPSIPIVSSPDISSTSSDLEPSKSDTSLPVAGGRPTPGSFRPTPPAGGSPGAGGAAPPAGQIPKRMPPKFPPSGPPPAANTNVGVGASVGAGNAGGVAATVNGSGDALQSRLSFRKSLPPNMAPPIAPSPSGGSIAVGGGAPPSLGVVPEVGSFESSPPPSRHVLGSTGSRPGSVSSTGGAAAGTSPNSSPAHSRRPSSLSAALPRFDTQLMAAEQEIRDSALPAGVFSTIAALPLEELRAHFLSQPSSEATKHLIAILAALASM